MLLLITYSLLVSIGFIWLEIWYKSRFNVEEFERFDCFMFFMKMANNQKVTDFFNRECELIVLLQIAWCWSEIWTGI